MDGRFNQIEGDFVVGEDPEQLFDRIRLLDVKATSIDTNNMIRDEDLRGERLSEATTYPGLGFPGDASERTGQSTWVVVGELTIRDLKRPL